MIEMKVTAKRVMKANTESTIYDAKKAETDSNSHKHCD